MSIEIIALLHDLQAAVDASDAYLAHTLAQQLRQRIAADPALADSVEQRIHTVLAELRVSSAEPIKSGFESVRGVEPGALYPVWFGTNRKLTVSGFTYERDPANITRGRVLVRVPAAHKFGETGNSFWRRLLRWDLANDRLALDRLEILDLAAFHTQVRQTLDEARTAGSPSHALVFIHGYNTKFTDAAIRAAQIGYDLKIPATAFFGWPSRGSVPAYMPDEAAIENSERAFAEFLVDFAAHAGAETIHVIAHSMGNRGLLRALQRISTGPARPRFGQFVLAAPDVDRGLFLDHAALYAAHAARTTLYTSRGDRAVHLSAVLHAAPRAGYFLPHTVAPGIDTVAVPNFDLEILGHSYFAQAGALLYDIHTLMHHDTPPAQRQRLRAATSEGARLWELMR